MRKTLTLMLAAFFAAGICASAATPGEQFAEMRDLLQKTPKDDALRESIVRLGRDLNPAPAVPEEARRALVRGNVALGEAKGLDDYARAARHYEEAANLAPWWGAAYLSLARAQELQFDYGSAERNMKLYILTATSPEDARSAQDYLYALQDKQERFDRRKAEYDTRYGWLSGQWSMTRKLLDKSGTPVMETDPMTPRSSVEDNRLVLKIAAPTTEHDYRYGGDTASSVRIENSFRLSYDVSGQLLVEVFGARDENTCPVEYGWNGVNYQLGAGRRTMTVTRDELYAPPNCTPSGYSTVWVFQRGE